MIVLLMKKTFLGFGLVLSLSLVAGAVAVATRETPYSVSASSYSVRSVPTTIDLNDTSESEIRSYYAGLNSLSASERQGTNLLKNLKPILKNGQKYLSYGSSATTAVCCRSIASDRVSRLRRLTLSSDSLSAVSVMI